MKPLAALAVLIPLSGCVCELPAPPGDLVSWPARPNVVVIFADDLGYGDLASFGREDIATPNLDRMAAEGRRFTSFYVAAPACSPSRAALLTGCYPQRVSVPHVLGPRSETGLNQDEVTLADLLKQQGYATACIGKWHLGTGNLLPPSQGFDLYFGLPYSNDMSPDPRNNPAKGARGHPPLPLIRQTEVVETEPDQSTLTARYTDEAVRFIREHADQPFLLYMPHTFPHVPLYASERFRGRSKAGLYGDVVEELDWSVGQVLETLEDEGLGGRTLVIFTSDNGPWLVKGDHAGSADGLREGKATCFEGGMREPTIAWWPGVVPAGTVCDTWWTSLDVLPTVAALCAAPLPANRTLDGRSALPLLLGAPDARPPHDAFYYYRGWQLHAVRSGRWKLHVPHPYPSIHGARLATPDDPGSYSPAEIGLSLFDLEADPGETTDKKDAHPEVVERLQGLVERARADLGDGLTKRKGSGVRPPGRVVPPPGAPR